LKNLIFKRHALGIVLPEPCLCGSIWRDIGARLPQAAQMKRGSLSESRTSSGQQSAFKDTQWQLLRLPTSGSEPE
jgi:hypothetical protein